MHRVTKRTIGLGWRGGALALLSLAACTPACAAPAAASRDICKWVDADGAVHYSHKPPPGSSCTSHVRWERSADPRGLVPLRSEQQPPQPAGAEEPPAAISLVAASIAARRVARCTEARDELRFLQQAEGMRLLRPGREGGEDAMVWIDDVERERIGAAWRRQADHWCGGVLGEVPPGPAPAATYGAPPPPRRR